MANRYVSTIGMSNLVIWSRHQRNDLMKTQCGSWRPPRYFPQPFEPERQMDHRRFLSHKFPTFLWPWPRISKHVRSLRLLTSKPEVSLPCTQTMVALEFQRAMLGQAISHSMSKISVSIRAWIQHVASFFSLGILRGRISFCCFHVFSL